MPDNRIKAALMLEIEKLENSYTVYGFINSRKDVYPIGSDTKVLSTVFELISRPAIYAIGELFNYSVMEPTAQNHYPDFTLMHNRNDTKKIAIDVKTTYRRNSKNKFSYTLGSYTSFIRPGNEGKNIVFPFNEYATHLVIGFVYNRIAEKKSSLEHKYTLDQLKNIPLPFDSVEYFVQDKWRISSDRAGSGNTTNIGSIRGFIDDFRNGKGLFHSEDEFLKYWRAYGRTASARENFSNISEFRNFKQGQRRK